MKEILRGIVDLLEKLLGRMMVEPVLTGLGGLNPLVVKVLGVEDFELGEHRLEGARRGGAILQG